MTEGTDLLPDWQRPPFEPGNTVALKHGAFSPRVLKPVAQSLVDAVMADNTLTFLQHPSYAPALAAWAQAEARVILLEEWVDGMPMTQQAMSEKGQTSPLELLRKWEATASTHRANLGLTPMSRARLGRDLANGLAADTARIMAELHRRDQQQAGGPE